MSGYKLVPVEPTAEMLEAYESASIAPVGPISKNGYRAMLDAAPAVQGGPVAWQRVDRPERIVTVLSRRTWKEVEDGVEFRALYASPQPTKQHPDVSALVDALEGIMRVEARDRIMPVGAEWDAARAALAAHRKGDRP